MQLELDAEESAVPIQILGLNDAPYGSGNAAITAGRTIPWLQPESGDAVWALWDVTYRDVIVLDGDNRRLFTFNLTALNLADPANYEDLKSRLLAAAQQDGMP